MGPPVLHGTAPRRPGDAAAPAEELPLPEMAPQHGQHPPEKEQQLHRQPVGLREAPGILLPPDAAQAAADMGHPLREVPGEGRDGLLPGALLHHRGVDHRAAALFPGGLPPQLVGAPLGGLRLDRLAPHIFRFRGFRLDILRLPGLGPDGLRLDSFRPGVLRGSGVDRGQGLRPAAGSLRLHGPLAAASREAQLRLPALQALAGGHGLVFLHRRVHGRSFSSGKRRSALPRRASPARPARGGTSIQAYRPPRGRKSYILLPFIIAVFSLTVNP